MTSLAPSSEVSRPATSQPGGFTLIELLLVLAMIVTLLAGFGAALRDDSGPALLNAQHLLAALLKQARDEASTRQSTVRMVVRAEPVGPNFDSENFNCLQLWQADATEPGQWHPLGRPIHLLPKVRLLPPDWTGHTAGGSLESESEREASTLARDSGSGFPPAPGCRAASTVLFLEFQPDGSLQFQDETEVRLMLGRAKDWRGQEPRGSVGRMRGVVLRTSGAISFLNPSDH